MAVKWRTVSRQPLTKRKGENAMTTKTYILTMSETTYERVQVLMNCIPCFVKIDWEELDEIPKGEQFEFEIQCRDEDVRTVQEMLADCV